jgi:hypothetical protein
MSNKVYDIKTGKDYKYIESHLCEIVAQGEDGNKVIINNSDVIYEDEVNTFKKIFKLLCKRGDIRLINENYSNFEGRYVETSIMLDSEEILHHKMKWR